MTLGQFNKIAASMVKMADAMIGNDYDFMNEKNCSTESLNTPLLVIQSNTVKELVRIAADIKDGKVKAWELIFKEGR